MQMGIWTILEWSVLDFKILERYSGTRNNNVVENEAEFYLSAFNFYSQLNVFFTP